jgi:ribitol-5-phosphate 2-dehydrogenase
MDTKRVEMVQREVLFPDDGVLVRPEYMAICAADQRYYLGKRSRQVLKRKLPLALIHEATGTVLYDFKNKLLAGSKAALIPLQPAGEPAAVRENYRPGSRFLSSDRDGFMQDIVALPRDRIIPLADDYSVVYVFSELVSVALNAIDSLERICPAPSPSLGVWGDGSMGYVVSLVIHCLYPHAEIYVFGKTEMKLQRFSFVSKTFLVSNIPGQLQIDHCFECVGNIDSETAIAQIIDLISPQGCVCLLGVSEDSISINTRAILEKGLRLIGNNRSDSGNFQRAVALIRDNELCARYLQTLISEIIEINSETDIGLAFERDVLNDFKTVLCWKI